MLTGPHATPASVEAHRRALVAAWAYGYEVRGVSLVEDAVYDRQARLVASHLSVDTARPDLDAFYRLQFDADTGKWVHSHPEPGRVRALFVRLLRWELGL